MEDAKGQIICCGDSVTILSSPDHGNHCGLVLCRAEQITRVLVRRVDGSEVTLNTSDVRVADRSRFFPGMTVASSTDTAGQLGNVTAAATELDLVLLLPDGAGAENAVVAARASVSPAAVRPVGDFRMGDYVVSGAWLGRVMEVCLDVDVVFDDGAACRISRRHDELWEIVSMNGSLFRRPILEDGQGLYPCKGFYPGQRVGGPGAPAVFKASRWLKGGYWKPKYRRGTVSKVEATSVLVHWIASSASGEQASTPAIQQSPHDLTFFSSGNSFEFNYWRVGDCCFFHGDDGDAVDAAAGEPQLTTADDRTGRRLWPGLEAKLSRSPRRATTTSNRRPLLAAVAGTRTTVDVLWHDGTRQRGVPSASLVVVEAGSEHDLVPGEAVARITTSPEEEEARVGIVRSFSYKDQMVRVSWAQFLQDGSCKFDDGDETLSMYDLGRVSNEGDPGGTVYYGDIVVRQHPTASIAGDDLSWVGHYVETCDDAQSIQVRWGDGNTSKVLFREITVVNEENFGDFLYELGEWVDEDEDTNNTGNSEDEDNSIYGSWSESDSEDDDDTSTSRMNRISVVIQSVTRLASKVFAQGRWYLKVGSMDGEASAKDKSLNGGGGEDDGSTREEKAEADVTSDDISFRFPHFEIVQSPSDHHYLDNTNQGTVGGRKWTKRVQKEWKILEDNNLPETIYVRAFEDRMDLLRAAMVGASGTPYHDGLFFFDLQLPPSSYPAEPPLVHYCSFGLQVNPNLYPSGTVCLSLLNTFGGRDESELWSPEGSSILQIVVSIQGLVLTAQPYYNEPSWAPAGTPMGQRNELPYSEYAYLMNLQTMLHLLRRPPAGFEEFVRDHFRRRGRHVIQACEAYRDGCRVGTLDEEGRPTDGSRERPCSAGFRIAISNVLPRLVEAFSTIGAQG